MRRHLLIATAVAALVGASGFAAAQSSSTPPAQTNMTQGQDQGTKATTAKPMKMKRVSHRSMSHKRHARAYGKQTGSITKSNAPMGAAPQAATPSPSTSGQGTSKNSKTTTPSQ